MTVDATEAQALAREKRLQMHRTRFAADGHLDLENVSPIPEISQTDATDPAAWTSGDRLLGEDRLLEEQIEFQQLLRLAQNHPPVARFFARTMNSRYANPSTLTYWLDRGGPQTADLAADGNLGMIDESHARIIFAIRGFLVEDGRAENHLALAARWMQAGSLLKPKRVLSA